MQTTTTSKPAAHTPLSILREIAYEAGQLGDGAPDSCAHAQYLLTIEQQAKALVESHGLTWCEMGGYDKQKYREAAKETIRDAAPDLLDALKLAVAELESHANRGFGSHATIKPYRAAIAKAEGR